MKIRSEFRKELEKIGANCGVFSALVFVVLVAFISWVVFFFNSPHYLFGFISITCKLLQVCFSFVFQCECKRESFNSPRISLHGSLKPRQI